ncbi:MAG: hypothetical protein ACHREM_14345, partial [Polyangiales bacterium]
LVGWTGDDGVSIWFGASKVARNIAGGSALAGIVTDGAAFYAVYPSGDVPFGVLQIPISGLTPTSPTTSNKSSSFGPYSALALQGGNLVGTDVVNGNIYVELVSTTSFASSLGMSTHCTAAPTTGGLAVDNFDAFVLCGSSVEHLNESLNLPSSLYEGSATLTSIAKDATSMYLTEQGAHARVLAGSLIDHTTTVVSPDEPSPRAILVDASNLYWLSDVGVRRAAKP